MCHRGCRSAAGLASHRKACEKKPPIECKTCGRKWQGSCSHRAALGMMWCTICRELVEPSLIRDHVASGCTRHGRTVLDLPDGDARDACDGVSDDLYLGLDDRSMREVYMEYEIVSSWGSVIFILLFDHDEGADGQYYIYSAW